MVKEFPSHYTQHLPGSFEHAQLSSTARQTENRQVETASYATKQRLTYFLAPERLQGLWEHINETIETTAGLRDFRDVQVYFAAKGTKLDYKTTAEHPTILDCLGGFRQSIDQILDFRWIYPGRFYVDIG